MTTLDLFLTGNGLLVTPSVHDGFVTSEKCPDFSVVLLVTDNTINPILNPSEVSYLFSMPLASFLHLNPTFIPGWNYGLSSRSQPYLPSSSHGHRSTQAGQTHQPALTNAQDNDKNRDKETRSQGYTTAWENEPRRKGGVLVDPVITNDKVEGSAFAGNTAAPAVSASAIKLPPPPAVAYANGAGSVGGKGVYYQYRDVPWGVGVVRFHRFLTGKEGGGVKPVYGLTA